MRSDGQTIELINEGEGIRRERPEFVKRSRERRCLGLIFSSQFREFAVQLVRETVDAPAPANMPADHGGFHEQALPTARRPQLSILDGCTGSGVRRPGWF